MGTSRFLYLVADRRYGDQSGDIKLPHPPLRVDLGDLEGGGEVCDLADMGKFFACGGLFYP